MAGMVRKCDNGEEWGIAVWHLPDRKRPVLVVERGRDVRKVGEVTDEELLNKAIIALATGEVMRDGE